MSVFGELNLESSRAVSDDEDDELAVENEEQLISKKQLYWFDNTISNVKQLIVACDSVSSAFLNTYLLNHDNSKRLIGIISTNSKYNIELNHLKNNEEKIGQNDFLNYIYLLNIRNQSICCIQCFDEIKLNEIYDVTNQIISKINFETSIILASQHRANYYGDNFKFKIPSIKYLTNQTNLNISWCDRLQEPNFVTHLPAAIMNICVALKKPVQTYICYKSTLEIDINAVKEFYNVLSKSPDNIYIDNQITKDSLMTLSKKITSLTGLYT